MQFQICLKICKYNLQPIEYNLTLHTHIYYETLNFKTKTNT